VNKHDEFLQPLRNRPGLAPEPKFKAQLQQKLDFVASEEKSARKRVKNTLVPNLLTAALLFIALFVGYDFINKKENQQVIPKSGEHVENSPVKHEELTDRVAKETVGVAFAHVTILYTGGGPQLGDLFTNNGREYRYMGSDFDTKEKALSYLEEVYTKELADRIYGALEIIEQNGKTAVPVQELTYNLLWQDTEVETMKKQNKSLWTINFKVPVENDGANLFKNYYIEFKYENGWKLNGSLPFTAH
jgi:hypothetical protein